MSFRYSCKILWDQKGFKEGDPGDKFYIILSGSVGIFIKEVQAEDLDKEESEEGDKDVAPWATLQSNPEEIIGNYREL